MAISANSIITNDPQTMDGSEIAWVVPERCISIAFQAIGGNVTLGFKTGDTGWTLVENVPQEIAVEDLSRRTLYLKGTAGYVCQIRTVVRIEK